MAEQRKQYGITWGGTVHGHDTCFAWWFTPSGEEQECPHDHRSRDVARRCAEKGHRTAGQSDD